MIKTTFTLISKKELTHDVFELVYNCPILTQEIPKPWQYVMFQLAPWLNRSYSLSDFTTDTFTLIIKRIPDGKWSPIICDAHIGAVFSGMIPLGHFVLRETPVSKCFIGTGTWFAPLYCQLLGCKEKWYTQFDIAFIFGVRELQDVFYTDEIRKIGEQCKMLEYRPYLSREESIGYSHGYVVDWIIPENISNYQEFYICGSPAMVKSAREKFEALGVENERIFFEQF